MWNMHIGIDAVTILSNTMREINIQARSIVDEGAWPPEQPKNFTPLALIHHQHQHNLQQSATLAEFIEQGHIDNIMAATTTVLPKVATDHKPLQKVLHKSTITKEVAEFLLPMETNKDP